MRVVESCRASGLAGSLAALLASALLGLGCANSGQHAELESPANSFELRRGQTFLWEVSKPDSTAVSAYLLGSVHILDGPLSLGPEIEAAFRRAESLVVEVDLDAITPEDMQELVIRYGMLTWGESLQNLLSPETYQQLLRYLDEQSLSAEQKNAIGRMRPWMIGTTLSTLRAANAGLEPTFGVDRYFLNRADGKRVIGLETIDEQFYTLSSLSDRLQETMLVQVIEGVGEGVDERTLIEAWKSGDEAALVELLFSDQDADTEAYYETLLFGRNELMSDGLVELVEDAAGDVCFAVVGVAHLIGEDSIPALLRDAGYRVERTGAAH